MTGEKDMAHHDIAQRLADATDEVEVGIAPYEAVIRGGKRRKVRRWALGAAAALVLAGSTGSLALAVVDGRGRSEVAAQQLSAQERHVYVPQRTHLMVIFGEGSSEEAYVSLEVWGAPRSEAEARKQKERMTEYGVWEQRAADPVPGIGASWFSVVVADAHGGKRILPVHGLQSETDDVDGMGFQSYTFKAKGAELTVGYVGPQVKRVEFEYRDGTGEPELMRAAGFKQRWFTEGEPRGPGGGVVGVRVFDAKGAARTVQ